MSRAPRHDPVIPMNAALNNTFGIIDFVDAPTLPLQAAAPPGMVVGGPPAYLEAHGIRYVPAASVDPDPAGARGIGPGGDDLAPDTMEGETVFVSQRELDARVDDRIQRFMRAAPAPSSSAAAAASARAKGARPMQGAAGSPADDVRARLKALRDECEGGLDAQATGRVLRSGRRVPLPDFDY